MLDEYLLNQADSTELRTRLGEFLAKSGLWTSIGKGSDLGYVPADAVPDWTVRWRNEGFLEHLVGPEAPSDEQAAFQALEQVIGTAEPSLLGRMATTSWLPRRLRESALSEFERRWHSRAGQTGFVAVRDEAFTLLIERLDITALRAMLRDPVLSAATRRRALEKLLQGNPDAPFAELLAEALATGESRVAAHFALFSTESDQIARGIAVCMASPSPEDDESLEVSRLLRATLERVGKGWLNCLVRAAAMALKADVAIPRILSWVDALAADTAEWSERTLLEALGTLERLRAGGGELAQFGLSLREVRSLLTRRLREETEGDSVAQAIDLHRLQRMLAHGQLSLDIDAQTAAQNFDLEWFRQAITTLTRLLEHEHRLGLEAQSRADDPANAAAVLKRVRDTQIENLRAELLESVRSEDAAQREREKLLIARLFSELLTATGRLAGSSSDSQPIRALERRVVDLMVDFSLEPLGRMDDEVAVDPVLHEVKGGTGADGVVRAIGIRHRGGRVLVRAGVYPRRR